MKKNSKKLRIVLVILSVLIIFCAVIAILEVNSRKLSKEDEEVYSKLIGVKWTRNDSGDNEILHFSENEDFGYYYSSGSPVGKFDLYDKYVLKKSGKIQLNGKVFFIPTRKSIKVISVSEDKLEMEINGKRREFVREGANIND